MLIYKVLKRKDAASVIVAVVIALLLMTALNIWSLDITSEITGSDGPYGSGFGGGWKDQYLNPAVSLAVQLVFLEALLWLWVGVLSAGQMMVKQSKTSSKKR